MYDCSDDFDKLAEKFHYLWESIEEYGIEVIVILQIIMIFMMLGLLLQFQMHSRLIGYQEEPYAYKLSMTLFTFFFWPACLMYFKFKDMITWFTEKCGGRLNPAVGGVKFCAAG